MYCMLIFFIFLINLFQIINLKRFQFLNGRWVKSHKIVNFPYENFDPSRYVVPRSSEKHNNIYDTNCNQSKNALHNGDSIVPNGKIPTTCDNDKADSGECFN